MLHHVPKSYFGTQHSYLMAERLKLILHSQKPVIAIFVARAQEPQKDLDR